MSATDELVSNNERYAATLAEGHSAKSASSVPARRVAVLACMDARLDVFAALGLGVGDAHVIRNAGGVASDDAIRSLVISQRLLGTEEILLVHHTDCGMLTFSDDELKEQIRRQTGIRPPFAFEAFSDLDEDVRQTIARIKACPFLPHRESVRGFVYDVESARLREVTAPACTRARA